MRRALFLMAALPLLMAAAPDVGWQQAGPDNARAAPPQLRAEAPTPTPRPDPGPNSSQGWQQAASNRANVPPPPQLRADAPSPTPRPDPRGYGPLKVTLGSVTAAFDVPYQTLKGYRPLTLDLYQPPPRNYSLPLVVFIHGGGFGGGDSRHAEVFEDLPGTLAGLAAQGYIVASVNYRLSGEARFPAALQDVKAAIRFLRGRARDMNLDVTRAAVWGVSTGGQLAALAGVSCGVPLFAPAGAPTDQSDCVQGVVDWYGPIEVKVPEVKPAGFNPPPVSETGDLLGCEPATCPPGFAKSASPLSYVGLTSPPFLIQQGAQDTLVPPEQSQKLRDVLKASNVAAELVVYPNMGHNFSQSGAPDPATVHQALEKMAAFLAATFPPGAIGAKARPPGRGSVY